MSKSTFRMLQLAPLASALFLTQLPTASAATMDEVLEGMEKQSPVDIRPDNTYFATLPPLQFNLSPDTDLRVENTGSPDHESAIKALEAEMAAPDFYAERQAAEARLSQHQSLMWEVAELMQQWEMLSETDESDPRT